MVAAIDDGNLDLARQTLDALISQPDPSFWALSEMARVREMLGESDLALTALKLALEKTEDLGERFAMLVRKAQLLYDADNKTAAREALRGILAEPDFNHPEGRNYCARIAGLHGDYELVEELFTPVGEGRQLMFERLYFGQILLHLDKPGAAREQFAAALELSELRRDRRYALDRIVSSARAADELPDLMDQWLSVDPHSARAASGAQIMPEQLEILVGVLGGELGRAQDVLPLLDREDLPAKTQKLIQSPVFQQRIIMVMLETGKSGLARQKYRELIALAKAARKQDDVIRYGRSLLNTAEHLPPSECLELGTMLLGKGCFGEADSAFGARHRRRRRAGRRPRHHPAL